MIFRLLIISMFIHNTIYAQEYRHLRREFSINFNYYSLDNSISLNPIVANLIKNSLYFYLGPEFIIGLLNLYGNAYLINDKFSLTGISGGFKKYYSENEIVQYNLLLNIHYSKLTFANVLYPLGRNLGSIDFTLGNGLTWNSKSFLFLFTSFNAGIRYAIERRHGNEFIVNYTLGFGF